MKFDQATLGLLLLSQELYEPGHLPVTLEGLFRHGGSPSVSFPYNGNFSVTPGRTLAINKSSGWCVPFSCTGWWQLVVTQSISGRKMLRLKNFPRKYEGAEEPEDSRENKIK